MDLLFILLTSKVLMCIKDYDLFFGLGSENIQLLIIIAYCRDIHKHYKYIQVTIVGAFYSKDESSFSFGAVYA